MRWFRGRFSRSVPPWDNESGFVTLTEEQARICRDAIYFCRANSWPMTDELFDFSETMAFLHRRLCPQYGDDCANLVSVIDQERAAYEASRSQLP
jgi:hypothetical protein